MTAGTPRRQPIASRATLDAIGDEPYRAFFPAATLAGVVGVLLWPLHVVGLVEVYPAVAHARIMAFGLFGGFIAGFLGTAMPGILRAPRLASRHVIGLVAVHLTMVGAYAVGATRVGDALFAALVAGLSALLIRRIQARRSAPPAGFVLVGLGVACAAAGVLLALVGSVAPLGRFGSTLQRLLAYQGFVLLPIMGLGPFLLPGMLAPASAGAAPVSLGPAPAWRRDASVAATAAALILASFLVEAAGMIRSGHALRLVVVVAYTAVTIPSLLAVSRGGAPATAVRLGFLGLAAGLAAVIAWPEQRTALLHLMLAGGFAIITFVVAMRVAYIHAGLHVHLKDRHRWLLVAVGLMLFGMATRVSGDFLPAIRLTHYAYGAAVWIAGVAVWAAYVLPRLRVVGQGD